MENGLGNVNGVPFFAMEDAKKQYMDRVQRMTHAELYMELMRVHTESARLLASAEKEIIRLKDMIDGTSFASSES